MKAKWFICLLCGLFLIGLMTINVGPSQAFVFGKHAAEMTAHDAKMVDLKAKTAAATKAADDATAKQDRVCKAIGFVPVVGLAMRFYNSGERKAYYAGKGNESYWGVVHAFFKLPSSLPEHAATDLVWQLFSRNWRELDPLTVWVVDGRPYWMDAVITSTKIFFGLAGAGVFDGASHGHRVTAHTTVTKAHHFHHFRHFCHAPKAVTTFSVSSFSHNIPFLPILGGSTGAAGGFLWTAAAGSSASLVGGTGYQLVKGLSPFRQYYRDYRWWTGENPTFNYF